MIIEVGNAGGFTEIKISGRLDNISAHDLEKTLSETIVNGNEDVLINFNRLSYINSSGLRIFLAAAKTLDATGKKLNFCEMQAYIKGVFDIAGFDKLFNFYTTRREAAANMLYKK